MIWVGSALSCGLSSVASPSVFGLPGVCRRNLKEINTEGIINGSLESDIRAEAYEQGFKAGRRSKEEPETVTQRSGKATGESAEA